LNVLEALALSEAPAHYGLPHTPDSWQFRADKATAHGARITTRASGGHSSHEHIVVFLCMGGKRQATQEEDQADNGC
jgi:hypothetical protein